MLCQSFAGLQENQIQKYLSCKTCWNWMSPLCFLFSPSVVSSRSTCSLLIWPLCLFFLHSFISWKNIAGIPAVIPPRFSISVEIRAVWVCAQRTDGDGSTLVVDSHWFIPLLCVETHWTIMGILEMFRLADCYFLVDFIYICLILPVPLFYFIFN